MLNELFFSFTVRKFFLVGYNKIRKNRIHSLTGEIESLWYAKFDRLSFCVSTIINLHEEVILQHYRQLLIGMHPHRKAYKFDASPFLLSSSSYHFSFLGKAKEKKKKKLASFVLHGCLKMKIHPNSLVIF